MYQSYVRVDHTMSGTNEPRSSDSDSDESMESGDNFDSESELENDSEPEALCLYGNEPEYSETEMTIRGEGGEGDDSRTFSRFD